MKATGPHANQPVEYAGAPLDSAPAVVIMMHGRGAAPKNILDLVGTIARPHLTYVAPAAAGGTWYPFGFMSPREQNEPYLSSAFSIVDSLVDSLVQRGFATDKIALLGFSQGACLSAEYVLRSPRQYGGVFVLSGGVIGPKGTTWDDVAGDLQRTPILLGCSDVDSHIPAERVLESEAVFKRLNARTKRILYPGMGHTVNEDEIHHVQHVLDMLTDVGAQRAPPT